MDEKVGNCKNREKREQLEEERESVCVRVNGC